MSDHKDIISFQGTGLDTDSDLLALGGGNSRDRLNVVLSDDGNHQVLTNIKGNTEKSHTLSTGTNRVMGSVEDKENDAVIYFINNSNNDHAIVRYNNSTDDFTDILSDQMGSYTDVSVLNIVNTQFVDAGIIGNEDDQFLVWAQGDSPKMINIKHAIDGNYSTTLTEDEISFYKKPFTGAIFSEYINTGTKYDVINKSFQFALRYVYLDKTVSTISPISEIAEPTNNMSSGRISQEDSDNSIDVTVRDIEGDDTVIEYYELLYRIVDIGDGAPGLWYIYDRYDFSATTSITINFKNDRSLGIVSDEEANRPYDFVPNKSNHVGIIDSNIAVFDVAEEGFDNVIIPGGEEPDVTISEGSITDNEVKYESKQTASSGNDAVFTYVTSNPALDYDWIFSINDQVVGSVVEEGATFSSYNFTGPEVFDFIVDYVTNLGITGVSASRLNNTLTVVSTTDSYYVSLLIITKTPTYKSLKTKASYKYGVRYGYGGKVGAIQAFDDLNFSTIDNNSLTATSTNYILKSTVELSHQAPEGATDYQIVCFGSNINYYEEYYVRCNDGDLTDSTTPYTIHLDASDTVIKRDDMVNRFRDAYSDSIDYGFEIEVGDEVRFVAAWENAPLATDLNQPPALYDAEYSFFVKSVSSTEIRLSSSALLTAVENYPSGAGVETEHFLIQIIKRNSNFSATAQEFSPVYGISNRNHLGVGTDTDQSYPGTPASLDVTEYFGDVWKSKQTFVNYKNVGDYGLLTLTYYSSWMEKPMVSLYYDSYPSLNLPIASYGRVNVVNEFSEQRGDRKIRWGGKFLDESGVNFLTKFESSNEAFLDDRNGPITKLQQIGDTLKVYQEPKVTSFYLKKKSSTDSEGNATFLYSDVIIDPNGGSQSAFDNGCTNFESYVKNLKNGYFFDVINANVVRDSVAGLEPISEYGMHTFFKEKSARIQELGRENCRVLGAYDDDNELYVISCIYPTNLSDSVNFSVAFHEPTNRWIGGFSLPTSNALEYYGRLSGKTYISFLNGQLYKHNDNNTRCNLWGNQYDSYVKVHSNINPNIIKIWDNLEINSTGQWSPSQDGDIEVGIPVVQQSRLKAGKFEYQEGEYRSEFLRDLLSGYSTPQANNLFNGDALRGYVIELLLRNNDTTEANLRLVKVNGTTST
jgi:hypothetical protein